MAARKEAAKAAGGRRRLGRGLTSLISTGVPVEAPGHADRPAPPAPAPDTASAADTGSIRMIAPDRIHPSSQQPRERFDEQGLDELAASIRAAGLMQPIVVRPDKAGGFELVVGERRWRAAQRIGLATIPAIVREIDDQASAEWALIENIQREDLNPIERADGFRRLIDEYGLTHQEIAERVGLNRSTVTNLLRLQELDDFCRDAIRTGLLSTGHGINLLSISNIEARRRLAERAIREGWSVRTLQQRTGAGRPAHARSAEGSATRSNRADLERRLGDHLGTKVRIEAGKKKGTGRLIIDFYTFDQFEGLCERLGFDTAP